MGAHNASKPKSRSQSLSDIPTINNLAGTSFRSSLGLWPPHPRTFNHRRKLQLRVGKRRPQSWTTFCLKWTAIAYCALSSIFLSMDLCKIFHRISQHTSKYSTGKCCLGDVCHFNLIFEISANQDCTGNHKYFLRTIAFPNYRPTAATSNIVSAGVRTRRTRKERR